MSHTCVPLSTCWIVHSTYASRETVTRGSRFERPMLGRDLSSRLADCLGSICENSVPGIRERKHDVSSETWPSYRSVDPGISKLLNVSRRLSDRDSAVNVFQTRFRAISRLEYRRSALYVTVDFVEIYERCFRDSNGEYNFRESYVRNGIPLRRVWNFYVFLDKRTVCRSFEDFLTNDQEYFTGEEDRSSQEAAVALKNS